MILVGIDPGKNTGLAVKRDGVFENIETTDFWGCFSRVVEIYEDCKDEGIELKVYIEDVTGNRPTFGRNVGIKEQQKIAQNVGMNKRDCQLLMEFFNWFKIDYEGIVPKKNSRTKMDAPTFKALSGYTKRTSEHGRDAAMLILGR